LEQRTIIQSKASVKHDTVQRTAIIVLIVVSESKPQTTEPAETGTTISTTVSS